jgi:hypothetical protein
MICCNVMGALCLIHYYPIFRMIGSVALQAGSSIKSVDVQLVQKAKSTVSPRMGLGVILLKTAIFHFHYACQTAALTIFSLL